MPATFRTGPPQPTYYAMYGQQAVAYLNLVRLTESATRARGTHKVAHGVFQTCDTPVVTKHVVMSAGNTARCAAAAHATCNTRRGES